MTKILALAIATGLLLTGCAAEPARTSDPEAIVMDDILFLPEAKTIAQGKTLTFVNTSSRALHVLVPGVDAKRRSEPGAPSFGGAAGIRTDVGDTWKTGAWNKPGTFRITCTLHPTMNLIVTVTAA